jgi:hypothetical protein
LAAKTALSGDPDAKTGGKRIGRTIMTMVLIVAFTLLWNLLCLRSPCQSRIGALRSRAVPSALSCAKLGRFAALDDVGPQVSLGHSRRADHGVTVNTDELR